MAADDVYTVAGSASGAYGTSGDGGPATSALLDGPGGVAIGALGDLYIADQVNNRLQEVAAATGTQWGQSMTAGPRGSPGYNWTVPVRLPGRPLA